MHEVLSSTEACRETVEQILSTNIDNQTLTMADQLTKLASARSHPSHFVRECKEIDEVTYATASSRQLESESWPRDSSSDTA
jgi:hypothetical protein